MADIPIAVLSFNRPQYLQQVLDSLRAQTALKDRPVFLFQDNAVSGITGRRYAADDDIRACVGLFRAAFPRSEAFVADDNIGVSRNYLRAEEHVFVTRNNEVAYFFEDDMVLSPHYLTMMDHIAGFALATDKVGYFAAYGRHRWPVRRQRECARSMTRLGLHWGFGVKRRHWTELRELLDSYYQITEGSDYGSRPTAAIASYYHRRGWPLDVTTQDHTKKVGTYMLGRVSINTVACFAKYIGKEGVNMNPALYRQKRYADTEMYPEPVMLAFPTSEDMAQFHTEEIERRQRNLDAKLAAKRNLADDTEPSRRS